MIPQSAKTDPHCTIEAVESRDPSERLEDKVEQASVKHPDQRRERSGVRAVMPKDRHKREKCIDDGAEPDPRYHEFEGGQVSFEQENDETGKEEGKGDVEEGGQYLHCPRDAQLNKTFSKKRAYAGSFMWRIPQLSDLDVSTHPML
jgi:hypothetical protein